MSEDSREALRSRIGRAILWAGVLVATLFAVPYTVVMTEGAKRVGSTWKFLGVTRWTDSPIFVIWGYSFLFAMTLLAVGSALRNVKLSTKLAISLPLGFFVVGVSATYFLWIPTVVPVFFGGGGTIHAIGSMVTCYYCMTRINPERPWPGFLRSMGYMSFAFAAWASCGIFGTPCWIIFPRMEQNLALVTDLAHKVQMCLASGWTLTALSFVLERKAANESSRAPAAAGIQRPHSSGERLVAATVAARSTLG